MESIALQVQLPLLLVVVVAALEPLEVLLQDLLQVVLAEPGKQVRLLEPQFYMRVVAVEVLVGLVYLLLLQLELVDLVVVVPGELKHVETQLL
tara:strand:+ start:410 stop:688 length:279 start_codon:yes stop_codon:yes gene_type:complete